MHIYVFGEIGPTASKFQATVFNRLKSIRIISLKVFESIDTLMILYEGSVIYDCVS